MSVLAATVVAVATTPVPSPEVIHQTIVETVPQGTPAVVVQAAQVAGVFAAGLVLSVGHRVTEYLTAKEKGWATWVNALVASAYTVGVGVVGTAAMGQLDANVTGAVAVVVASGVASIGTFWSYAVRKALAYVNGTAKPASTTGTIETDPLVIPSQNIG